MNPTNQELIDDYKDRIKTPIFIGIRKNYLENEEDVKTLKEYNEIKIEIDTPIKIGEKIRGYL